MAYSFLVFDFGENEDAAQQARHRIDGWRQGYRLDRKMQVRFDRSGPDSASAEQDLSVGTDEPKPAKSGDAPKPRGSRAKVPVEKSEESAQGAEASSSKPEIKLIVRLDFSEHEKLSHHRWLERIPTEEPFKQAKPAIIRPDHSDFASVEERFGALEGADAPKYSK